MTTPVIERAPINREHRTYMQRRAESSLAEHPYRVELTGGLSELDWPSICANCGTDTHERFTVQKVFGRPRRNVRQTGSYQRQVIRSAQIPYCGSCIARHRALTVPRSLLGDLWHMLWPVLIPMAGAGWFFLLTLRIELATPSSDPYSKYAWGLPALFGAIVVWCVMIAWYSSRALRVEKQSEVTKACDFSDDVSWMWERERRIYSMRNERFARAFGSANASRAWSADDDRRSRRVRTVTLSVAAVVAAAVWAVVVLAPR
jgi:hypothetical protein